MMVDYLSLVGSRWGDLCGSGEVVLGPRRKAPPLVAQRTTKRALLAESAYGLFMDSSVELHRSLVGTRLVLTQRFQYSCE